MKSKILKFFVNKNIFYSLIEKYILKNIILKLLNSTK